LGVGFPADCETCCGVEGAERVVRLLLFDEGLRGVVEGTRRSPPAFFVGVFVGVLDLRIPSLYTHTHTQKKKKKVAVIGGESLNRIEQHRLKKIVMKII